MSYWEDRKERLKEEAKKTEALRRRNQRLGLGVVAIGGVLMVMGNMGILPFSSAQGASQASSQALPSSSAGSSALSSLPSSSAPAPSSAGNPEVPVGEDWRMILVNVGHAVPQDFTVGLVEFENGQRVDGRIAGELRQMFDDALAEGLRLQLCSGFRTVSEQQALYAAESYNPGEPVSVQPAGESEHHTGLAVDINTADHPDLTESFETTATFSWLSENAWTYGFILRYPRGKEQLTGVTYEPWHFRYVGREYAEKIKASGLCLEEYLAMHGVT